MKANRIHFPTGSSFSGQFRQETHSMEGFGNYKYPDGTEYRGFFARGRPHGFGKLILAHPYRLRLQCHFENGEMTAVEPDMEFHDSLPFYAEVSPNFKNVDYSKWKYLNYVYKQKCREILDRNITESLEYGEPPHKMCAKLVMKKLHEFYWPGLCDPLSSMHPHRHQKSTHICDSKGSSESSSFSSHYEDNDELQEMCRQAKAFVPTLPEVIKAEDKVVPSEEGKRLTFDNDIKEIQ